MPKKAETRIVKKIVEALEAEFPGIYIRKIHGNMYQHVGIPDLIACYRGRFIAMEVKTESGKTSGVQDLEGAAIVGANGIYLVPTSAPEAIEGLKFALKAL